MNTGLWFTGGNIAERLMRNRGRTRAWVSAWNHRRMQERMDRFIAGKWKPSQARQSSPYAISLTSWSRRMGYLELTLLTLMDQNVRPSGIHVWLTKEDLEVIPSLRRELFEDHGVCFETCPDYRSHKKWLPMVLGGRMDPFVVCDDDILYPREWFGRLVAEDRADSYVGCKCHKISINPSGMPRNYAEWEKQIYHRTEPSMLHFTTGCGGEILHPKRLSQRALDWDAIQACSMFSDDVWLKAAHLAAGVPVFKTRYCFPCLELPGTDESGLHANHNVSKKDGQLISAWQYFKIPALNEESS